MSLYPAVKSLATSSPAIVWTPNTGISPGPPPIGPARRAFLLDSSLPYVEWRGFVASSSLPLVGDIITQGMGTSRYVSQGYATATPATFTHGDIITQGMGTVLYVTQGYATSGTITIYPDPFSATSLIIGVDPFSATSVVAGVDPFAATSKLYGN